MRLDGAGGRQPDGPNKKGARPWSTPARQTKLGEFAEFRGTAGASSGAPECGSDFTVKRDANPTSVCVGTRVCPRAAGVICNRGRGYRQTSVVRACGV